VPWHFKLLVAATVLYLGFRAWQGFALAAEHGVLPYVLGALAILSVGAWGLIRVLPGKAAGLETLESNPTPPLNGTYQAPAVTGGSLEAAMAFLPLVSGRVEGRRRHYADATSAVQHSWSGQSGSTSATIRRPSS